MVLEDVDHDGQADKRTVFYQSNDINTPLGIFVAGSRVYVSSSPNVFVLSDTNADLVADKRDVLFTNLGKKGDHSVHALLPGADGKLYLAMGNMAGDIRDRNGRALKNKAGIEIGQNGEPYRGGMILQIDTSAGTAEVIGHNFRNNYEPCMDAYGNMWQTDNDDDGNAACRINFIFPYGNYGYVDELTGAAWTANRVDLEANTADRHWHQHDPGVVPNVLVTGAGSPAGMTIYEGEMLPPDMHGMPVLAEPYENAVKYFRTQPAGAGFTASAHILLSSRDKWFRPVDVAVAHDGSLFVADWYDPILGDGAAGDARRGRIYRLSTKTDYTGASAQLSSLREAAASLNSPSLEVRHMAFMKFDSAGDKTTPLLMALWKSRDARTRVRALWLLAHMGSAEKIIMEALADSNAYMRIAAVRAARQQFNDPVPFLIVVASDIHSGVRREVALSLRYIHTLAGARIWTTLANAYDANDRWYIEALGIGADLHADLYFDEWLKSNPDLSSAASKDIIWRTRSAKALPYLVHAVNGANSDDELQRYFRAFDFHAGAIKNRALEKLLSDTNSGRSDISILALRQMDKNFICYTPSVRKALEVALTKTRGQIVYVELIEKFRVTGKEDELIGLAIEQAGSRVANAAVELLLQQGEHTLIEKTLKADDSTAFRLLNNLEAKGKAEVVKMVKRVVADTARAQSVRQKAVQVLGSSWPGEEALLDIVAGQALPASLRNAAASVLFNVYRSSIRRAASAYLPAPVTNGQQLPPVKELIAATGNAIQGKAIFSKLCGSCHRIGNEGVKFGPELGGIADKLSREGLFRAIIYPDEGVSLGYESQIVTLKDGTRNMGIVTSETVQELELAQPGGGVMKVARRNISKIEKQDSSIMPALAGSMSVQQLVDLVAYLESGGGN